MALPNQLGLPSNIAELVLPLAADVIEQAASVGRGRWGLTPMDSSIRVNVGWTEILTTCEDRLRLVVDGALARRTKLPPSVTLVERDGGGSFYPSIPGSVLAELPYRRPRELAAAIDALRPALVRAVSVASKRREGRGVKAGHSQASVKQLGDAVGRELPEPGYRDGSTYLFAWNPALKSPASFRKEIQKLERRGSVRVQWRSGSRRQLPTRSRAFVIRLGKEPRGIIGSGWTRTKPAHSPPSVEIEFDALQETPAIPFPVLQHSPFSGFYWSIRGSGVELPPEIAVHLEVEWQKHTLTTTTPRTETSLFQVGIYVNANPDRLRKASRGAELSRPIVENKRWVRGRELLDQARALGQELPLVFAHFAPLTFWAVARDIVLHEKTTEYRFAGLRELRGFHRSDLVLANTGGALPNDFIRSYALIRTPDFLTNHLPQAPDDEDSLPEEVAALEGEERTRMIAHRRREGTLRAAKIENGLRDGHGHLICEVPGCGFDFLRTYGPLGSGYAQVHHLRPLADYAGAETTRIEELAIVCANCHAMIHRGGECRTLAQLILLEGRDRSTEDP